MGVHEKTEVQVDRENSCALEFRGLGAGVVQRKRSEETEAGRR